MTDGLTRTGRDSNPRYRLHGTHAFQACLLNHSSTCPYPRPPAPKAGFPRAELSPGKGSHSRAEFSSLPHRHQEETVPRKGPGEGPEGLPREPNPVEGADHQVPLVMGVLVPDHERIGHDRRRPPLEPAERSPRSPLRPDREVAVVGPDLPDRPVPDDGPPHPG